MDFGSIIARALSGHACIAYGAIMAVNVALEAVKPLAGVAKAVTGLN